MRMTVTRLRRLKMRKRYCNDGLIPLQLSHHLFNTIRECHLGFLSKCFFPVPSCSLGYQLPASSALFLSLYILKLFTFRKAFFSFSFYFCIEELQGFFSLSFLLLFPVPCHFHLEQPSKTVAEDVEELFDTYLYIAYTVYIVCTACYGCTLHSHSNSHSHRHTPSPIRIITTHLEKKEKKNYDEIEFQSSGYTETRERLIIIETVSLLLQIQE